MLSYEIVSIPALQDNDIWMMIHHPTHNVWIVDRGDAKQVSAHVNCDLQDPIEVFAALREWKDTF